MLAYDRAVLHLPLTLFAKSESQRVSSSSLQAYLAALAKYFMWADAAPESAPWHDTPDAVRANVGRYLSSVGHFVQRRGQNGISSLHATSLTALPANIFLSAMKSFYTHMAEAGLYKHENPLISLSALQAQRTAARHRRDDATSSRIPTVAGVTAPDVRRRLSDSYFQIVGRRWKVHPIEDEAFLARVLHAGEAIGWGLREQCITLILFQSGARVSEACGLTMKDWRECDRFGDRAWSRSKGSFDRRTKFLNWLQPTTKLLERYVNTHRTSDPSRRLSHYRRLSSSDPRLDEPLFLTAIGTSVTAALYRRFWRRLCDRARMRANVHQIRHHYVTAALRHIYTLFPAGPGLELAVEQLIAYMGWRSGRQTLAVYEHHLNPRRYLPIAQQFLAEMTTEAERLKEELVLKGESALKEARGPADQAEQSLLDRITAKHNAMTHDDR